MDRIVYKWGNSCTTEALDLSSFRKMGFHNDLEENFLGFRMEAPEVSAQQSWCRLSPEGQV